MISYLAYVSCDRCGAPAQPASGPDAKEARGIARREGFARLPGTDGRRTDDVCPRCRGLVGRVCRFCGRSGGELTENGCPTHGSDAVVESATVRLT